MAKKKAKKIDLLLKRGSKYKRSWDNGHMIGRPPAFNSPEQLYELAQEYFQWIEDNPLLESKMCSFQGVNEVEEVPKKRPFTLGGLCLYLGVHLNTLLAYRDYANYSDVYKYIELTIREQKFEGAAAGFFNHAIIARDLGLKGDETTVNVTVNNNPEQKLKDKGIPLPDMGTVEDVDES
ncbi:DNA-packaging protein [Candidatus Pacearchaeota archaeon]|nr:DNA-packaging protein [Candidatus Pacearchaeota archaeon]